MAAQNCATEDPPIQRRTTLKEKIGDRYEEIERLLKDWNDANDSETFDRLMTLLYVDLKSHARILIIGSRPRSLGVSSLVQNTCVSLVKGRKKIREVEYFWRYLKKSMHNTMLDRIRKSEAGKRQESIDPLSEAYAVNLWILIDYEKCRRRLEKIDPRYAAILDYKKEGMTEREIAEILGLSERSVRGLWKLIKSIISRFFEEKQPV